MQQLETGLKKGHPKMAFLDTRAKPDERSI